MTGTIATAESGRPVRYVGRFAPSPTGPLHFGSLLAAMASYLEARTRQGQWLVRIEDIDPPREQAGSAGQILNALEHYGFEWDKTALFQSQNREYHDRAIESLAERGLAYRCGCSRSDLAGVPQGPLGAIYPGTCRDGYPGRKFALRVRTTDDPIEYVDGLQGRQLQRLQSESGDFVVLRRDGLVAYHLAVVVDDHLQGITDVVRGIDLMGSTQRQIWLQHLLDLPTPRYFHIPVAVNSAGQKLSKSTGAAPLPLDDARPVLAMALAALGQDPPADLAQGSLGDLWAWARHNWNPESLAGRESIAFADGAMAGPQNGLR